MSARTALLAVAALALAACSRHGTDADDPATAGTSAQAVLARAEAAATAGRAQRAKAEAAGMLAAQGLAAERGKSPAAHDGIAPGALGAADADGYAELEWTHMLPAADVALLDKAPPVLHIGNQRGKQFGTLHTVAALDGRKVRLPGYVVPLGTDDAGRMNEFFFVPFYGACIHVPPPPPNMMVHVTLPHGVDTPSLWDPFWLKGVLRTETTRNSLAASAYAMHGAVLAPYSNDDMQNLRNAFE